MTVFLVRHAKAGDRDSWRGDDELRPLSAAGWSQAESLVRLLAQQSVELVASSPFLRCVQTVEPLAKARGVEVNVDEALAEGNATRAIELVKGLIHVDAVLCSHGDVIPQVLDALAASGLRIEDTWRWEKGSVWILRSDDGRFTGATYIPAPKA